MCVPLRWLAALVALVVVILYIADSYTGFIQGRDKQGIQLTTTFHSIHVHFHGAIEHNIQHSSQDEVFIKHDDRGGWEKFMFTTPMTVEERLRRSSLLPQSRSIINALTTKQMNIPSITSTISPNSAVHNELSKSVGNQRAELVQQPLQQGQQVQLDLPPQQLNAEQQQPLVQLPSQHQQEQYQPQEGQSQQQQQVFIKPSADVVPKVRVTDINCAKLFDNDDKEYKLAQQFQKSNQKVPIPDEEYSKLTQDCDKFKKERQYILQPLSQEESDFSIAFSIVVFKDMEQIERLLRAIYRPQNHYCLHVDIKSNKQVKEAVANLANCFDNVFISSRSVDVQWGWFSVLEPELICMQDLLKYKKWKYFINLTGQEWPLKTNEDLVKILKTFNGANSMEGTVKR